MTKNRLISLWLAAVLLFVFASVYLPHDWQYSGEGSYLFVNLTSVWIVILLVAMGFLTVRWFLKRK